MTKFVQILIKVYRKISRLCLPPRCRFYPSCSQYALDAIHKYGICRGGLKTLGRILRCSPFSSGGYDPA